MIFTILAYKENWVDTCRGCIMDSGDSDFEFSSFSDINEAIEYASQFRYKSMIENGTYQITLLCNGIEYYYSDVELDIDWESKVREIATERYNTYLNKKEKDRLDAIEKEKQREQQKELELLSKLKEKYKDINSDN